jgi:hypothetical protein
MAVAQLPFVIGLSGKNNVISFLTGVTHEKVCRPFRRMYTLSDSTLS